MWTRDSVVWSLVIIGAAVAYGRQPGSVDFAQGWAPEVVLELQDDEGQVRVWRARR